MAAPIPMATPMRYPPQPPPKKGMGPLGCCAAAIIVPAIGVFGIIIWAILKTPGGFQAAYEQAQKDAAASGSRTGKNGGKTEVPEDEHGPKPTVSGWDGSVPEVVSALKNVMNDPGSFKHVSTDPPMRCMTSERIYCWLVHMKFRGKNAFGALILQDYHFYVRNGQVIGAFTGEEWEDEEAEAANESEKVWREVEKEAKQEEEEFDRKKREEEEKKKSGGGK
ncbi:MAG: hypothetical protein AAB074_17985 [Planctomycetota bacterium]|mgnify:CR=1 FL=1